LTGRQAGRPNEREAPILLAYAALGVVHKLHWTTFREVWKKLGLGSCTGDPEVRQGPEGMDGEDALFAVALEKLSDDSGWAWSD
jgi:hypothetical protein